MMYAALIVVHVGNHSFFNFATFIKVVGAVSVVTTANRYLPIPGGEGMMQLQMRILLSYQEGINDGIDNAIFL
jgi:uncharacterized membrane protein YbhN (UPF0104 family)